LGHEPDLQLVAADHVAHDQVTRAVIVAWRPAISASMVGVFMVTSKIGPEDVRRSDASVGTGL